METSLKFPVIINRKDEQPNEKGGTIIEDIEIIINFDIIIIWFNYRNFGAFQTANYTVPQTRTFLWNNPPDEEIMELIIEKLNECMGLNSCIGVLELFATKQ